jgi:hypothetical protein
LIAFIIPQPGGKIKLQIPVAFRKEVPETGNCGALLKRRKNFFLKISKLFYIIAPKKCVASLWREQQQEVTEYEK